MKKNLTLPRIIPDFLPVDLLYLLLNRCQHEPKNISDSREVCFKGDVLPLLRNFCGVSNCHNEITAEEGYIFTHYASIVSSVNPGNAQESLVYRSLFPGGEDLMAPYMPCQGKA